MSSFIAYLRVSTQKQGESGLGLEAQSAAIARHVAGGSILRTFTEVESGNRCDRPQLDTALAQCRATGATLVVAKLDRLARDLHFIAGLMKAGVDFVACDMPHANRLTLHILAAVAEDEARRISDRTRSALAAAKARGAVLGGFRGRSLTKSEQANGRKTQSDAAKVRAARLAPVLQELRADGCATYAALAVALTERGYPAPRGGVWSPMQVRREALRLA